MGVFMDLKLQTEITKPEPVFAYKRHAYKKTCTSNSFVALPRLHATVVDCAHELINGESGTKREVAKILKNC